MKYLSKETEQNFKKVMDQCCCLERPKPDLSLKVKIKNQKDQDLKLENYHLEMRETEEGILTRLSVRFNDVEKFNDISELIRRDFMYDQIEAIAVMVKDQCSYCSSNLTFFGLAETVDPYLCQRILTLELEELIERPDADGDIESK